MDFRKKLKIRLYLAISYIILGIAMVIVSNIMKISNPFLNYWGLALAVIGFARLRQYRSITKTDESVKRREIAENDERNIAISSKAKSIAFTVYVLAASVAVIILQLIEMTVVAAALGYTVIALVLIYWVSYFIIRKKS